MTAHRDIAWVGIDVGKTHHWACMVDAEGKTVSSIKVANDEADIVALMADAGSQATQLVWAIDIIGAPRRCCWPCWLVPTSRCGMHPGGSLRR